MSIENWGVLFSAIIGGGTILSIVVKYSYSFIKDVIKMFKKLSQALDILEKIKNEVGTNGGKSLKDTVCRIERRQVIQQGFIRHILNNQVQGAFEADVNGNYVWVNPTYLDVTGQQLENVINNGWISYIHNEDRNRVQEEWDDSISKQREFNIDCRLVCEEGIITPVRFKANPIRDESERVIGYLGDFRIINK